LKCKVVSIKENPIETNKSLFAKNSEESLDALESRSQPSNRSIKKPTSLFANSQPVSNDSVLPSTSIGLQSSISIKHVSFDETTSSKSKRALSIGSSESVASSRKSVKNSNSKESDRNFEDFLINQLIELSKNKEFPKKEFSISNSIRKFTVVLHFIDSVRVFEKKPEEKLEFVCKICSKSYQAKLGETTNLNKHLSKHTELEEWMKSYDSFNNGCKKTKITEDDLKIIEFVISSNTSLSQLKNPTFHNLSSIKLPCYERFRDSFLPQIMEKLKEAIKEKLNKASFVCLIVDLWSSKIGSDFIALVGLLGSKCIEREIVVLDMIRMNDSHTAENIKLAIENIINSYSFDRRKITCK